jgi:hypothetical protein
MRDHRKPSASLKRPQGYRAGNRLRNMVFEWGNASLAPQAQSGSPAKTRLVRIDTTNKPKD